MAYTRKAQKPDIRSLNIKSLPPEKPEQKKPEVATSQSATTAVLHHNPVAELKRIALCGFPLILILMAGSYFDATRHWVIPFANWLMNLGS